MRLDYITTAVQGINPVNDVADFFLKPLRTLFEGRTFQVIYTESGEIDEIHAVATKVTDVGEKIFAFLLVLTTVPLILGLACKLLALASDAYGEIEQVINSYGKGTELRQTWAPLGKGYTIAQNGLSITPPSIQVPEVSSFVQLVNLVDIWDTVGKKRSDYQTIRSELNSWLRDKVPYDNYYLRIDSSYRHGVRSELTEKLKSIIHYFQTAQDFSNDKKEAYILRLYDAATVICAQNALEIVDKICEDLFCGTFQEKVLRIVQTFKENIATHLIETILSGNPQGSTVHAMNRFRVTHGSKIGLSEESIQKARLDTAMKQYYPSNILPLADFRKAYCVSNLLSFVVDEINHAKRPDEIVEFLAPFYLVPEDPKKKADKAEQIMHVREHFFSHLSVAEFEAYLDANDQYASTVPGKQTLRKQYESVKDIDEDTANMFKLNARSKINVEGATAVLFHLGVIEKSSKP